MRYSPKTRVALCRALTHVIQSHAEMGLLFEEHEVTGHDSNGGIQFRVNALVRGVQEHYGTDDTAAERVFTELIEYALRSPRAGLPSADSYIESLRRALRIDGFEWRDGKLLPTTPEPVELAAELSQLEVDLHDLGLTVAVEHYRQSYESFVAGNWEAANGQVRSFVENLFVELGKRQTPYLRDNAHAAIQDLRTSEFFDQEETQMLKGFWQSIQDNGPHHGLSNEQEALFRLHLSTSIARYSIHKHRAAPGS